MHKTVFVNGYTSYPNSERVKGLSKFCKTLGVNLIKIDPLKNIRKSLLFKLTKLTIRDSEYAAKSIEEDIGEEPIDLLMCFSYGVVAVLQKKCRIKRLILMAPSWGDIKFHPTERLATRFFKGFREMENGDLKKKIFKRLEILHNEGTEIIFLIPENGVLSYGDNRVGYTKEDLEEISKFGKVITVFSPEHKDIINSLPTKAVLIETALRVASSDSPFFI